MVVYDEVSVRSSEIRVVDNGKKSYKWKDRALKLELSAVSTASFTLNIVSSSKFDLPEGVEQFSPVYWVESEGELGGPVEVELQHSGIVTQDIQKEGLKFAVCTAEDEESSYNFELCEGQFDHSHGKLEIEHFCHKQVVVVRKLSAVTIQQLFLANLYTERVSPTTFLITFIIVPRQEAWEKVKDEGGIHSGY